MRAYPKITYKIVDYDIDQFHFPTNEDFDLLIITMNNHGFNRSIHWVFCDFFQELETDNMLIPFWYDWLALKKIMYENIPKSNS